MIVSVMTLMTIWPKARGCTLTSHRKLECTGTAVRALGRDLLGHLGGFPFATKDDNWVSNDLPLGELPHFADQRASQVLGRRLVVAGPWRTDCTAVGIRGVATTDELGYSGLELTFRPISLFAVGRGVCLCDDLDACFGQPFADSPLVTQRPPVVE